jgi:hypothetical protein
MSGDTTPTPSSARRTHSYHAQAFALDGDLQLPLKSPVKPQAFVKVAETGGYLSERSVDYRLEGIFAFRHAYTQVAGHESLKPDGGWTTLATSVIEGFNVLEVVTADRIVSQISTHYPQKGYVPEVTFLGTRFENLRIAGHPVRVELDLNLFGDKPANDATYHSDKDFRGRVAVQREKILKGSDIPEEIAKRYNRLPPTPNPQESIECSLVQHVEGSYPGRTHGHVIDIPHFGKVYLGVVTLEQSVYKTSVPGDHPQTTIKLTMVDIKMGCIGHGGAGGGNTVTNGTTAP